MEPMYVLTRTSGRPRFFAALRESLRSQDYPNVIHVVHSDDPADNYVEADITIRGGRMPIVPKVYWGPELYNARLIRALEGLPPGWVTLIDDDDEYVSNTSISQMVEAAERAGPDTMPVWRIVRPSGLRPRRWMNPNLAEAKLSWPSATFHTRHLTFAVSCIGTDPGDGDDWKFWRRMNVRLPVAWVDAVLTRPQLAGPSGKGRGMRRDRPPGI